MERIRIWTDGCCLDNLGGPGGWAFVVERHGQHAHEDGGGTAETTNNRMELAGVIEAVRWARSCLGPVQLEVISDSKYVVDGCNSWRHKWARNGWRTGKNGKGRPIKNFDLWSALHVLLDDCAARVTVSWIKGHAGHKFNEDADRRAGVEAGRFRELRRAGLSASSTPPQIAESPAAP